MLALGGEVGLWLAGMLNKAVLVNLILAVFNMLPLPPLDGGRVAVGLLPLSLARPFARLERYGLAILLGLLFLLPFLGRRLGLEVDLLGATIGVAVRLLYTLLMTSVGPA